MESEKKRRILAPASPAQRKARIRNSCIRLLHAIHAMSERVDKDLQINGIESTGDIERDLLIMRQSVEIALSRLGAKTVAQKRAEMRADHELA